MWVSMKILLRKIYNYLHGKLGDILVYFLNRYIKRTHLFETKLKEGEIHSFNHKIISSSFEHLSSHIDHVKNTLPLISIMNNFLILRDHAIDVIFALEELMFLDMWYNEVYKKRKSPYDNEEYNAYVELINEKDVYGLTAATLRHNGTRIALERMDQYNAEDEEMLIRLIKVRNDIH